MMSISDLTLTELSEKLGKREISSQEATECCLERIREDVLNNFITVCEREAMESAREADRRIARGESGELLGVPIAIKDNIVTRGILTTAASKFLGNFIPPYDATVVKKLKSAGAVILGKTNMDEFAMGSTNENSAFGAVKNANDFRRVPGGSSGGSANCIAARQAFAALGSDTGGSIRQPASYCGVVGFKPTYSAVSRNGLIAFASSLDQIGPLAKTTDDCLAVLKTIVGRDSADSTSAEIPALPERLTGEVKGKVFGVAKQFVSGASPDVKAAFESAVKSLESAGAKIEEVSINSFDAALAVYYVLSSAEAASNLARYDGVKYGRRASSYKDIAELYALSRTEFFGAEVKRRIMIGNYVLSSGYYDEYYLKASKIRTIIKKEYDRALERCDALLCPTAPTVAPMLGATADPADAYLADIYTVPVNIAGLPAVSVPYARSKSEAMPIGLQVIGRAGRDGDVLELGKALETARGEI